MKISTEITAEQFPFMMDIHDDVIREAIDQFNDQGIFNSNYEQLGVWISSFIHEEEVVIVGVGTSGAYYFTKEFAELISDNSKACSGDIKIFESEDPEYCQFLTVNLRAMNTYRENKLDLMMPDTKVDDIMQFIDLEMNLHRNAVDKDIPLEGNYFTMIGDDEIFETIYVTKSAYEHKKFVMPFVKHLVENASS